MDNETAVDVIRRHQNNAPVNVERIAHALGMRVVRRRLGSNIGGTISRNWRGEYEIGVNSADAPRRQRFTIAHEVAHFVLHRDLIGSEFSEDKMYRGPIGSWAEVQANRLAADILMPYFLISRYWNRGLHDARSLAHEFDVSVQAMEIRLKGFQQSQISGSGLRSLGQ